MINTHFALLGKGAKFLISQLSVFMRSFDNAAPTAYGLGQLVLVWDYNTINHTCVGGTCVYCNNTRGNIRAEVRVFSKLRTSLLICGMAVWSMPMSAHDILLRLASCLNCFHRINPSSRFPCRFLSFAILFVRSLLPLTLGETCAEQFCTKRCLRFSK